MATASSGGGGSGSGRTATYLDSLSAEDVSASAGQAGTVSHGNGVKQNQQTRTVVNVSTIQSQPTSVVTSCGSQQQHNDESPSSSASSSGNVVTSTSRPHQTATIIQQQQGSGLHQYITVTMCDPNDNVSSPSGGSGGNPSSSSGGSGSAVSAATPYVQAYPVFCVADTASMYTAPATAYYAANTTAVTYTGGALTHGALQGQILAHPGGGTYLLQTSATLDNPDGHQNLSLTRASPHTQETNVAYLVQTAQAAMDADASTMSHATRVSPATVQWLIDNYETAEGVSLPRSTLYNHYLRHCNEHKIDPVNAASFGKLIRSVFLGLRTRRLGTRGNSKYHYYGIRVKPNSPLNQLGNLEEPGIVEGNVGLNLRQPLHQTKSRYKLTKSEGLSGSCDSSNGAGGSSNEAGGSNQVHSSNPSNTSPQQQFLGDPTGAIPYMAEADYRPQDLPEGVSVDDFGIFRRLYRDHCEALLDAVYSLQFSLVELLWQQFWRNSGTSRDSENEKMLSRSKLYALCDSEAVQEYTRRADYQFYQNLVEVLVPDVLRPIPSSLTQAIRNFAKSLESWLTTAMIGCPTEIIRVKVSAVSAFAQTLRRYTSLNHLAQAARAVLQNPTQITQMLQDLNRVDFHNVQEQASWVCQCEDGLVQKLEQDFKNTLQQQNSLEQWATWLESVVSKVLRPYEGKSDFAKAARQFLLKWSFYSSMVIRDLTLRSAASFGSFHLIRLLYDEYMFYVIEHRVAEASGDTPIAVMADFIGLGISHHQSQSNNVTLSKAPPVGIVNGNQATVLVAAGSASVLQQQMSSSVESGISSASKVAIATILPAVKRLKAM